MSETKWVHAAVAVALLLAPGFYVRDNIQVSMAYAQAPTRVFELRIYTAQPGKFEAMKARFRDHIIPLFTKHGMTVVGFWTAADAPNSSDTLAYVLAYPSRDAAKKSWDAFRADPERLKVWAESEKDGPINLKVQSTYLNPIDFSPIK